MYVKFCGRCHHILQIFNIKSFWKIYWHKILAFDYTVTATCSPHSELPSMIVLWPGRHEWHTSIFVSLQPYFWVPWRPNPLASRYFRRDKELPPGIQQETLLPGPFDLNQAARNLATPLVSPGHPIFDPKTSGFSAWCTYLFSIWHLVCVPEA